MHPKTLEMFENTILENDGTLKFLPDCYRKEKNV